MYPKDTFLPTVKTLDSQLFEKSTVSFIRGSVNKVEHTGKYRGKSVFMVT